MCLRRSNNVSPSSDDRPCLLSLTHFSWLALSGRHKGKFYKLGKYLEWLQSQLLNSQHEVWSLLCGVP